MRAAPSSGPARLELHGDAFASLARDLGGSAHEAGSLDWCEGVRSSSSAHSNATSALRVSSSAGVRFAGPDLDAGSGRHARAARRAGRAPGGRRRRHERPLGAARCAARRASWAARPEPGAIVSCQHKPTSRAIQQRVAPQATPRFALLDGAAAVPPAVVGKAGCRPVCLRRRAASTARQSSRSWPRPASYRDEYADLAGLPRGRRPRIPGRGARYRRRGDARGLRARGPGDRHRRHRLGEVRGHELVRALRVSVGAAAASGWTSWPSWRRARAGHGLDACFFNIEFFVPDDGRAQIVELNPRIASQFSPLVEAVHGRLDLRRAVRARLWRGSGAGTAASRTASPSPTSCASSRTRSSRPFPSRRTDWRSSSGPGSGCPSRARTTRRATGSRSSPSGRRRGRLRFGGAVSGRGRFASSSTRQPQRR